MRLFSARETVGHWFARGKGLIIGSMALMALPSGAFEEVENSESQRGLLVPMGNVPSAIASIFDVDSTGDVGDATAGDGFCETASGQCTLRAAIQEANAHAGDDRIEFGIPTSDPGYDPATGRYTINLFGPLPDISQSAQIIGPGANKLTVRRNTGEAYRIFSVTTTGVVTFSGITISRGFADSGGGILNAATGTVNIIKCTVSGNSGGEGIGGGILNNTTGTVNVTNSTVSGNFARIGGGIDNPDGTVNVSNSTISGNSAYQHTGGIANDSGAILNISNSTISGNSAPSVGGVFNNSGTVTVKSSIIALNTANTDPDLYGAYMSAGFNLIGDPVGSSGFDETTDQIGTSNAPLDPKLDPNGLENNGGPVQTIALLSKSPAIDKGTSDGLTGILTTDQRGTGFPRTFNYPSIANAAGGDGTDIGAFELLVPFSVSRKMHGTTNFDIGLPLTGPAGIECRSGGASGIYKVIVTFATPVTVTSASVTTGIGV